MIINTISTVTHVGKNNDPIDENEENSQPREVFFALAKSNALKTLTLLQVYGKMKLQRIAESLEESPMNAHHILSGLEDMGMIERTSDGGRRLSVYGENAIKIIDSFQFLDSEKKFFSIHTFDGFPNKFIRRVGVLYGDNHRDSYNNYYKIARHIIDDAKEYIFMSLQESPLSVIPLFAEKLKSGDTSTSLEIRLVLPNSEDVEKNFYDELKEFGIGKENCGVLEVRQVQDVKVAVILNEKESAIFFPNAGGKTDFQDFFYSSLENNDYLKRLRELAEEIKAKAIRMEVDKTFGQKRIRDFIIERLLKMSQMLSENEDLGSYQTREQIASILDEIEDSAHSQAKDDPAKKAAEDLCKWLREEIREIQNLRITHDRKNEFHILCLDYFRYKYHENDPTIVDRSPQYYTGLV